jgi:pyrroloquinoline quinone biosynthesis protein B
VIRVLVLGAAAGGGLPQWNCNCEICRRAREGDPAALASDQASIAVSADGDHWFLINASPDLRHQINSTRELHPRGGLRHSPIAGVVLTNGDVDAIAGLLTMREKSPFTVYGHERVLKVLSDNSIFNVLDPALVKRVAMPVEQALALRLPGGEESGLEVVAFPVPGKIPLYLEDGARKDFGSTAGDALGLHIRNRRNGAHFFYVAACAEVTPDLAERLRGAPLVFFDGTLWSDDEMIRAGLSQKSGKRMGHISMSGDTGSIAAFRDLGVHRKVFLHINNSNPALLADSTERQSLERAGWEVPSDGSEFKL